MQVFIDLMKLWDCNFLQMCRKIPEVIEEMENKYPDCQLELDKNCSETDIKYLIKAVSNYAMQKNGQDLELV